MLKTDLHAPSLGTGSGIADPGRLPRGKSRYLAAPALAFALGLLSTLAVTIQFHWIIGARDQVRFERLVESATTAIRDRMETYVSLLRAGAALFAVKPDLSRADWKAFADRMRVAELYPGIQGVGFARRFAPAERAGVIASMRAQGHEDFAVRPADERAEYTAILYLEPLDRRNRAAVGYDMFTEATRREAMERARDSGRRALSGKVELVQEIDADKQAGFLIYVPVYAGGGVPSTLEERRARLIGWSYSPFRAGDFFSRFFPRNVDSEISYRIFDGVPRPENLLHASHPASGDAVGAPMFQADRPIEIAGRQWTLSFAATPAFDRGSDWEWASVVFLAGLLVTLLLSAAAWGQSKALADADAAREDLRNLNQELERRVAQRTTELAKARDQLQRMNANLEEIVAARTAELETANEEIQRFAYIVSHDLRAPLVNVMGFTSELENARDDLFRAGALPPGDPARERAVRDFDESLSFIRAATAKMDGLIGAILKISREGRRTFRPEPLDMEALVKNLADAIRHQTDAVGATIEIGTLPTIVADRLSIEQIFGNLLDNAMKYLVPGRPGRISVTGEDRGGRIVYKMTDNGRGIAKADHKRVFELFRRAGAQDKPGEGIGLAHVKALIRALGGYIELESEPGVGTTFTITLPKSTGKKAA